MKSFAEVVQAFVDRGKELQNYNGELAQAGAMADVRSLMGDIREARELGPELARLTDEQSKLWDELRRDFEPVKRCILEWLVAGVQEVRTLVAQTEQWPARIDALKQWYENFILDREGSDRTYKMQIAQIERNTRKPQEDDGLGKATILDELRKMRANQAFVPGRQFGPDTGAGAANQPLFPKG